MKSSSLKKMPQCRVRRCSAIAARATFSIVRRSQLVADSPGSSSAIMTTFFRAAARRRNLPPILYPSRGNARFPGIEHRQKRLQLPRQGGLQYQRRAALGMRDHDLACVQEHVLQSLPRELLVERKITILVVAGDGKSEMGEMHADLMSAPGLEFGFEQAIALPFALQPEHSMGGQAIALDRD